MHGLHGSQDGYKSRYLMENFKDVHIPNMHSGYYNLNKNSILMSFFKTKISWIYTILLIFLTYFSYWKILLLSFAMGLLFRKIFIKYAIRKSFFTCKKLQEKAVEEFKPDIIIGSSWGGAIAASLIVENKWNGKTILLAPAFHRINEKADIYYSLNRVDGNNDKRIMIVQSEHDKLVTFDDGYKILNLLKHNNKNNITLEFINDESGHRMSSLVNDGLLMKLIERMDK